MKTIIFLSSTSLIFLFSFYYQEVITPSRADKVALIVGISDYPTDSGWRNIHGENDIPLVKEALKRRGFQLGHIHVLEGPAATRKNIADKLTNLASEVAEGGFFVFHFSGHGQQVEDVSGDEVDGLDEALVPYDAQTRVVPGGYDGKQHLVDEDLGQLLLPIKKALGKTGQLLVLVDACHSGTAIRGEDKLSEPVRGTTVPLTFSVNASQKGAISTENTGFFELRDAKNDLANTILISATRPTEVNVEYCDNDKKYYGPLSHAFSVVFTELKGKDANYQILFEQLQTKVLSMTNYQAPTMEGNKGLVVGKNLLTPVHDYYKVLKIISEDEHEAEVNVGKVLKIHPGSKFAFYPAVADGDTTNKLVAIGEVYASDLFTSKVVFKLEDGKLAKDMQRAYLIKQDYGDLNIRVALNIQNAKLLKSFQSKINAIKAIDIVDVSAKIIVEQKGSSLQVFADGRVIDEINLSDYTIEELANTIIEYSILSYAQTNFLARIDEKNEEIKLVVRIVLVEVQKEGDKIVSSTPIPDTNLLYNLQSQLTVPEGSYYQLEVTNKGTKSAYLSVLDLQPNGKINVAIPYPDTFEAAKKPSEYIWQPGETRIIKDHYWEMWKPYGLENYLFIATDVPIDLRSLNKTRGKRKTSTGNSFEELVKRSWNAYSTNNKTRNGIMSPITPSEVNIEHVTVEIVKK